MIPCSDPSCDICCGEMYDGGEKMVIDANGTQCVEIRQFGRGGVFLAAEDRDKGERVIVTLSKKQAKELLAAVQKCVEN